MMEVSPLVISLMIIAGIFYLACSLFLLRPYLREKNELIGALLAFLVYQAVSMFFMGLEMQTHNMLYSNIASLAVFIGSVYLLKFPFSSLSQGVRKVIFYLSLVVVLCLFIWFMQTEQRQKDLMHFTLWYDLIINGIIVGGFMIIGALRAIERPYKIKTMGGGVGMVTCCVMANGAMLGSAMLTSSFFGFLAPVIILTTFILGRRAQSNTTTPQT